MINFPIVRAVKKAYQSGQGDEDLKPIVAVNSSGHPIGRFKDGDYVIFYDLRGEREVELTESFVNKDFDHFPVKANMRVNFVTMIEYSSSLKVKVAFPPEAKIRNTFGEVVSKAGLRLVKIAESEKAAHIGYFMNGKSEEKFPGEERFIVPSPHVVSSYTQAPEMSISKVAREILSTIKDSSYQVVVANFANVDVVGHNEDKTAILKAVKAVDQALGKIVKGCQSEKLTLIVTSDHGTVEEWYYPNGTIHTGHTKNPVPFILADFSSEDSNRRILKEKGELGDVAPTLLDLLGLEKPREMTGKSLLLDTYKDKKARKKKRIFLLILDGWGIREEKQGNLIAEAGTPSFNNLWSHFPHCKLQAAGEAVGMPAHTVGNSEAGHLHLGAGRRVLLDRVRIDKAIEDGSFFSNKTFRWAMQGAKKDNRSLHLLGIVSHYSSHGTIKHLFALLRMVKELALSRVFVHALIGRRGEKLESGTVYLNKVEEACKLYCSGKVVTVMGRFWALDREENWGRIEKAYRALVYGEGAPVLLK